MPSLGPELAKQFLRRVHDEQRLPLFVAFVAEVKYQGDLTHYITIYRRAKQLRDMVGHSHDVRGPVYGVGSPPVVSVASTVKAPLVRQPLFPSTFTRFTADCEWLKAHVYRAGYAAMPEVFFDGSGNPAEPPIPALLPEGGEPL